MTQPAVPIIGIAWYRRQDYAAARAIMADGDRLPASFEAWQEIAQQAESQARRAGQIVIRAIIDPQTFPGWCAVRGLNIDAKARMAFAGEQAHLQARQ